MYNEIWWKGAGLYAPRNHGSVAPEEGDITRWYGVEDDEDARRAGLGTPQYFEEVPDDMTILRLHETALQSRLDYIAYCPTCGGLTEAQDASDFPSVRSTCPDCSRRWCYVFQEDESGTFGVIGFQCDSGDRIN